MDIGDNLSFNDGVTLKVTPTKIKLLFFPVPTAPQETYNETRYFAVSDDSLHPIDSLDILLAPEKAQLVAVLNFDDSINVGLQVPIELNFGDAVLFTDNFQIPLNQPLGLELNDNLITLVDSLSRDVIASAGIADSLSITDHITVMNNIFTFVLNITLMLQDSLDIEDSLALVVKNDIGMFIRRYLNDVIR